MREKKPNKKTLTLPIRINLVFVSVFILFAVLLIQLALLQIVDGAKFAMEMSRTNEVVVENSVPRGKILDRFEKTIVDNEPTYAITYTKKQTTSNEEMISTANKLADFIEMDTSRVRDIDIQYFWLSKYPKKATKLLTHKELVKIDKGLLSNQLAEAYQLERIPKSEIEKIRSTELEICAIFKAFKMGYALSPQIIKNIGVTYEEIAVINEHLEDLPGINTTTDWNRVYPFNKTLKSVLGKVTTTTEGLPKEKADYYRSLGYSRNDRVGKSFLELQYENILRGEKEKTINITDKAGNIIQTQETIPGKRGKDLVLTVDFELQQAVEQIITEELLKYKQIQSNSLLDRAFVVLMNPKTGEILTLAGKQYVTNEETHQPEIADLALGTFTTSYAMGSTVKGATVLTGYDTGAILPKERKLDEVLHIKDTPDKKSWRIMNWIDDLDALRMSSNVYMFKTAIKIGGGNYIPNGPLSIDLDAFRVMRNHFNQFGLGLKTGIDLPGEQIGYKGAVNATTAGKLLDLAIGQYDTYTPLQLCQYISTIGNGGFRIQPHILKEIHEPAIDEKLGPILKEVEPKVQNRIPNTDEQIARVQEGLREVCQTSGGTAFTTFSSASYKPAGKTGTAESFYDGPMKDLNMEPTMNITFASYAPNVNPEIAMSVVVPWAYQGKGHYMNLEIAKRVFDTYFSLKAQRGIQ